MKRCDLLSNSQTAPYVYALGNPLFKRLDFHRSDSQHPTALLFMWFSPNLYPVFRATQSMVRYHQISDKQTPIHFWCECTLQGTLGVSVAADDLCSDCVADCCSSVLHVQ